MLEERQKNEYNELCSLVYTLENLVLISSKTEKPELLVYAEIKSDTQGSGWEGRVQATTKPIMSLIEKKT